MTSPASHTVRPEHQALVDQMRFGPSYAAAKPLLDSLAASDPVRLLTDLLDIATVARTEIGELRYCDEHMLRRMHQLDLIGRGDEPHVLGWLDAVDHQLTCSCRLIPQLPDATIDETHLRAGWAAACFLIRDAAQRAADSARLRARRDGRAYRSHPAKARRKP